MRKKTAGRIVVLAIFASTVLHADAQEISPKDGQVHEKTTQDFKHEDFFGGFSYANLGLGSQASLVPPTERSRYGATGAHLALKVNLRRNIGVYLFDARWSN